MDHTQFMILSELIIKDGGDGVLHTLFEQIRNMIPKQVNHIPFTGFKTNQVHPLNHRIKELKHSVCKVAGSCL